MKNKQKNNKYLKVTLFVILIILIIAIIITMAVSSNKNKAKISKNKALEIVASELKNHYGKDYDFSRFNISANLEDDGWHVIYEAKNPEPTVNAGIASGFVYLVNKDDGDVASLGPIIINPSADYKNATFSEIPGFSFEYPVFKGWEVKGIEEKSNNEYIIWVKWPEDLELEYPPYISIKKTEKIGLDYLNRIDPVLGSLGGAPTPDAKKNSNNALYDDLTKYSDDLLPRLQFYGKEFGVLVLFQSPENKYGFDRKILTDKIIETFKFENNSIQKGSYGEIINYKNKIIEFRNFTLKYIDTTEIPGPNNAKWNITTYNFNVSNKNKSQKIGWSSGTGVIAPLKFTLNDGKEIYYLELKHSEKFNRWLKEDELVVLSEKQFNELRD